MITFQRYWNSAFWRVLGILGKYLILNFGTLEQNLKLLGPHAFISIVFPNQIPGEQIFSHLSTVVWPTTMAYQQQMSNKTFEFHRFFKFNFLWTKFPVTPIFRTTYVAFSQQDIIVSSSLLRFLRDICKPFVSKLQFIKIFPLKEKSPDLNLGFAIIFFSLTNDLEHLTY